MSRVTDYVEERRNEIESEGRMRQGMRRVTVRLPGEIFVMLAELPQPCRTLTPAVPRSCWSPPSRTPGTRWCPAPSRTSRG